MEAAPLLVAIAAVPFLQQQYKPHYEQQRIEINIAIWRLGDVKTITASRNFVGDFGNSLQYSLQHNVPKLILVYDTPVLVYFEHFGFLMLSNRKIDKEKN